MLVRTSLQSEESVRCMVECDFLPFWGGDWRGWERSQIGAVKALLCLENDGLGQVCTLLPDSFTQDMS